MAKPGNLWYRCTAPKCHIVSTLCANERCGVCCRAMCPEINHLRAPVLTSGNHVIRKYTQAMTPLSEGEHSVLTLPAQALIIETTAAEIPLTLGTVTVLGD